MKSIEEKNNEKLKYYTLTDSELKILSLYLGGSGRPPMSIEEIAAMYFQNDYEAAKKFISIALQKNDNYEKVVTGKSLSEHKVVKKTKIVVPDEMKKQLQKTALTATAAIVILSTTFASGMMIKNQTERIQRENEFNQDIVYMEENIMPEILNEAGFKVKYVDENNQKVYDLENLSSESKAKALDILMEKYNLTRDQGELLLGQMFDFDKNLYYGQDPNDYFSEYSSPDKWDNEVVSNIARMENQNEVGLQEQIERLMQEEQLTGGDQSNARN